MSHSTRWLAAADGHRIAVHAWPVAKPAAVLLVAHGMAEHGLRYAPLAAFLNGRGIAVYALDHRGHGQSIGSGELQGHYADDDGWNKVVGDLRTVVNELRHVHAGLPLVLLGHSMGSFISQAYAAQSGRDIDALVLSGSNFGIPLEYRAGRLVARIERWRQGARANSALLEFLSFGAFNKAFRPVRTAYDWLSRDAAEVDLYIADPLCGFRVSNQLWIDLLGGLLDISRHDTLARIPANLPTYLFSGERDPVGRFGKGVRLLADRLAGAGLRNVRLMLYPDGRHEMLNETNRAVVHADLAGWLHDVLPH